MDLAAARLFLAEHGWLKLVPGNFREAILMKSFLRVYERGEPVYRIDDPSGGMFGVASGGIALEVAPGSRAPYIGHFMLPGTWLGQAALITRQPRRVGVIATRPSTVLVLPTSEFSAIAASNPEAWRWLALLTVLHNDLAVSVGDDLMIRDPQIRATAILLRLAGCRGVQLDLPEPSEIDLSQEQLARLTNLSRTTLGEMLRQYEEAGWISQSYRRLTVLAPEILRKRCSADV
jgi:CRP/FNR family cyclic AMP-dependent transcriptional regulator